MHDGCQARSASNLPCQGCGLYAGAEQRLRLSLEIDTIEERGQIVPVVLRVVLQMPFCALSMLARSDRAHLPNVFFVAPLSGHFSVLLRDLPVGRRPEFECLLASSS